VVGPMACLRKCAELRIGRCSVAATGCPEGVIAGGCWRLALLSGEVRVRSASTCAHVTWPMVRPSTLGLRTGRTGRTRGASGRQQVLDSLTGGWFVAGRTSKNLRWVQNSRLWTSPAGGIRPNLGGGRRAVGASTLAGSGKLPPRLDALVLAERRSAASRAGLSEWSMWWTRWGWQNGKHVVAPSLTPTKTHLARLAYWAAPNGRCSDDDEAFAGLVGAGAGAGAGCGAENSNGGSGLASPRAREEAMSSATLGSVGRVVVVELSMARLRCQSPSIVGCGVAGGDGGVMGGREDEVTQRKSTAPE
jgi:hypothetical protein